MTPVTLRKTLLFNKTSRPRIAISLNKNQNYHVTFVNVTSDTNSVPRIEHLLTSIEPNSYLCTDRTQLLKDEDSSDLLKKKFTKAFVKVH